MARQAWRVCVAPLVMGLWLLSPLVTAQEEAAQAPEQQRSRSEQRRERQRLEAEIERLKAALQKTEAALQVAQREAEVAQRRAERAHTRQTARQRLRDGQQAQETERPAATELLQAQEQEQGDKQKEQEQKQRSRQPKDQRQDQVGPQFQLRLDQAAGEAAKFVLQQRQRLMARGEKQEQAKQQQQAKQDRLNESKLKHSKSKPQTDDAERVVSVSLNLDILVIKRPKSPGNQSAED